MRDHTCDHVMAALEKDPPDRDRVDALLVEVAAIRLDVEELRAELAATVD